MSFEGLCDKLLASADKDDALLEAGLKAALAKFGFTNSFDYPTRLMVADWMEENGHSRAAELEREAIEFWKRNDARMEAQRLMGSKPWADDR